MNTQEQVYRLFSEVTRMGWSRSEITEILEAKKTKGYAPKLEGKTLIAFRWTGASTEAFKQFGKWYLSEFRSAPYLEAHNGQVFLWVRIDLPEDAQLTVSDTESFVVGLDQAYEVFDPAPNRPHFKYFDARRVLPFPLPLIFPKPDLEAAYERLSKARIYASAFLNSAGQHFARKAEAWKLNQQAKASLDGPARYVFAAGDSERSRIFRVCRYLAQRDMKIPTIETVETFWRESGLGKIADYGSYDVYWQNEVAEVLEVIERDFSPEKIREKAAKYKIGMWRWLIETTVDAAAVEAQELTYPELEIVLGVITKDCLSERWQGRATRESLLAFFDKVHLRTGLRIGTNKFPKIVKLLTDARLLSIEGESGYQKARVYGLGEKHPLYQQEKMYEQNKYDCTSVH